MSGIILQELLPNKLPYTNPSAISNSGNKYFTNQKSKIFKLNMSILDNSNASVDVSTNTNANTNTNTTNANTNIYMDFKEILEQQKNLSKSNKLINDYIQ